MAIPGLSRFNPHLAPYLLPYSVFILYVVLLLLARFYSNKRFVDFIFVLSIVLFAGLKQPFTQDLRNYRGMFESPETLSLTSIEPVFILTVNIIHFFSNNYIFLFLCYEFFTILFVYLSIRKVFDDVKNEYILAWLTFLSFPFMFLNTFGVLIRESLAYAIFLYASLNWINGEKKKSVIFFTISMLSHYSAIVALFIWSVSVLLFKSFYKTKNKTIIFAIATIIAFVMPKFTLSIVVKILSSLSSSLPVLGRYASDLMGKEPFPIVKLIAFNVIGLAAAFTIDRVKLNDTLDRKDLTKLYSLYFTAIGVLIDDIFHNFNSAARISYYFSIYLIIAIPYISYIFKSKLLNWIIISLLLFIFLYGLFYITPNGHYAFLPCKSLICELFYR